MGYQVNQDELGWIGSFLALGAASMSLIIGYICDLIGRKLTKLLVALPMFAGWALLTWAQNVAMVYGGRLLTGMALGAFMVTNPVYVNEISQKEIRGILGSFTQLFIAAGILFDAIVGKFVTATAWYTFCCFLVPAIFFCLFIFMPETPIYYFNKGKDAHGKKTLARLRDEDYDIETELEDIKVSLKNNERRENEFVMLKKSFKSHRSTRRAFAITLTLMIFRVFCAIDSITAYTSYIFANATSKIDPGYGTIILMSVQFAAALVQSLIIDKVGRKILLLISEVIVAVCLLIVGLCFLFRNREIISSDYHAVVDYLALVALSLYTVGFSLGIAPIPLILNAELNPRETNSLVTSFNTFAAWIVIFGSTKTFLLIDEWIGVESAIILYGILSALGILFVFFFVPETKGKTPEEIRQILEEKKIF